MGEPAEHAETREPGATGRRTYAGMAWVLGSAALLTAWVWPRPTAPHEPPGLPADREAQVASLAEQARLAADAPTGSDADALLELERERGRAEGLPSPQDQTEKRRRNVLSTLARIVRAEGDGALDSLRAQAVERFAAVLWGDAPDDERDWVLGSFPAVMARYDAMTIHGEPLAPRFVLRTMYAARWNVAHGLDPTRGLDPAGLRAYHGWLAFEVESAPPAQRLAALDGFEAAGGTTPPGARAALLSLDGRWPEAADAFIEAYEATGSLRFRNHALYAVEQAAAP